MESGDSVLRTPLGFFALDLLRQDLPGRQATRKGPLPAVCNATSALELQSCSALPSGATL